MAGAITQTNSGTFLTKSQRYPQGLRKVKLEWTSDASGNVSGIETSESFDGVLESIAFIPGAGGVAPTAAYDVTLLDEDGVNVIGTAGANLSETTASRAQVGAAVLGKLTLVVANAGDSKQGTVVLYVR